MISARADRRGGRLRGFAAGLALALAALPSEALAQSCPLCRETAAQAPGSVALNYGIVILLVPTIGIFAGILYRILRNR